MAVKYLNLRLYDRERGRQAWSQSCNDQNTSKAIVTHTKYTRNFAIEVFIRWNLIILFYEMAQIHLMQTFKLLTQQYIRCAVPCCALLCMAIEFNAFRRFAFVQRLVVGAFRLFFFLCVCLHTTQTLTMTECLNVFTFFMPLLLII